MVANNLDSIPGKIRSEEIEEKHAHKIEFSTCVHMFVVSYFVFNIFLVCIYIFGDTRYNTCGYKHVLKEIEDARARWQILEGSLPTHDFSFSLLQTIVCIHIAR